MAKQQRAGQPGLYESESQRPPRIRQGPQGAQVRSLKEHRDRQQRPGGARSSERGRPPSRGPSPARDEQESRDGRLARERRMARDGQSARERQIARDGQSARERQIARDERSAREKQIARDERSAREKQMTRERTMEQPHPKKKVKVKRFYDYSLLFTIIFLTMFGLVMIYSSSSYSAQLKFGDAGYYMKRQGLIALGGFFVMLVISKMDYHFFARFAILAYLLSYVLMILVMATPLGVELNGKKRWLQLGPVQFQPTELVKIALILLLAVVITQMGAKINKPKALLWIVAVAAPIAGLVAKNNLSSGIIIMGIAFVMCFVACKLIWPFVTCVGLAGVVMAFAGPIATALEKVGIVQSYQLNRIHVWLDPEAYPQDGGYQVLQGLYAIGSGGLVGKGLGESIQKMGFVPEAQNDMVFAIICEELGIFGAVFVILLFLFLIYRFMLIASNAPDLFGAMLVVGVMGHIAIQVILNIAVVTNTIPNTGITLPFISYGGTSVVFLLMEMGMVLSVSNQIKLQK